MNIYYIDTVAGDDSKSGLTWALRWLTYAHAATVMVAGDILLTSAPSAVSVVSQTAPLLSLEQFRQQIHYSPWHFWGWQNATVPVTSSCNSVVKEYAYQTQNAVGRNEIRQAIIESEKRLRDYLQYSIAPHFVTEDIKDYPHFYDKQWWARYPMDARSEWKPVMLSESYIQAVGIESLTLLATPTVAYSDADGDGLKETFTLTFATTITDTTKIAVYFAAADRLNSEAAGERWRIQPVTVSIASGICTVKGKAWMLAKPILYEPYNAADLDPATSTNFVSTLECYNRTCDPTGNTTATAQGMFTWETLPYTWWWGVVVTGNNATDPAAQAYSIARVGLRDAKAGIVIPGEAIYNSSTDEWTMTVPPWNTMIGRPPDRVTVRYYAGYPLAGDGQMDSKFQTADVRLALAQLDNRISACDEANREIMRWQKDLAQVMDRTDGFRVSDDDLDCPFGTRRGAVDAWRQVKHLRLLRGISNQ